MSLLERPAVQLLVIGFVAILAYSNSFRVPFIFDDLTSIVENPVITDLGNFLSGGGLSYNSRRVVGYLTFTLNYRFGGLDVTGYHVVNLAIHIGNALLMYALVRLTLRTPFLRELGSGGKPAGTYRSGLNVHHSLLPLLAALLFVSHPIQTQAVTYVVQRLASLAAMFYLAALVFYIKGRLSVSTCKLEVTEPEGRKVKAETVIWFSLSLIAAVLAMKTKEIAFTLPLITLLYELFFFKATGRKKLLFLLPIVVVIIGISFWVMHGDKPLGEILSDATERTRLQTDMPRLHYLFTQFRVIVTYLRLLVFPVKQNVDYDYPIYHSLFTPPVFFSFLLLLALFALAVYLFFRTSKATECGQGMTNEGAESGTGANDSGSGSPGLRTPILELRLISFGILWFFITLSVESSVIPIVDVIFEHRLYLPSAGAFIVAAVLIAFISTKLPTRLSTGFITALVLLLAATTWNRNLAWSDSLTLWTDTAEKSPGKARPYLNVGTELMLRGRVDEAIEQFQSAIRLKPDYAEAYANLGAAFNTKGWVDDAIEQLRISLRLNPDDAEALNNVGTSFAMKGLTDYAITYFQAALRLKPQDAKYHYNLAIAYGEKGWADKAGEEARIAGELNPRLRSDQQGHLQ